MKLISVKKSTAKNKKYTAIFDTGDKIHFGDNRYSDFTIHKDKDRRTNYRSRHASGKTAKPNTADSLSYWLLWGESTSLQENIRDFKKRFNL